MSIQLQAPSVGPIVGHTDHQHSRIFLRGDGSAGLDLDAQGGLSVSVFERQGAPLGGTVRLF